MNTKARIRTAIPIVLAAIGTVWMLAAVWSFERSTGRSFNTLAGYHYTTPESGFVYHPDGERIHRWVTKIPGAVTFGAILASLTVSLAATRALGWRAVSFHLIAHGVAGIAFAIVWLWFEINITGVFI